MAEYQIGIENWKPIRKKPVLTLINNTEHIKVASFNNQESADLFYNVFCTNYVKSTDKAIRTIRDLQEQIPKWHLVADNDFPTELEIVNVVWCNHNPPSYYQNIKDKRFVASAVYFKGKWYWYSSTCIDYLEEYGKNDFDLIDKDVEVIEWMELPKFSEVE